MPWIRTNPPSNNKHTMKAKQLDAKAEKARRRGDLMSAVALEDKANKKAAKGGWL